MAFRPSRRLADFPYWLLALALLGVSRELTRDTSGRLSWNAGDFLLPRRGIGGLGIVVAGRPLARQVLPFDAVFRHHQVEDGGDKVLADLSHRHSAAHGRAALGVADVKASESHTHGVVRALEQSFNRISQPVMTRPSEKSPDSSSS